MLIWIVGLAGSGKTTLGRELVRQMRCRGMPTVLIDGDDVRSVLSPELGHSIDDRRTNGDRIVRLGAWLVEQQINVVVCILSIFKDHREWNRMNIKEYFEIYMDVPMEVLEQRDQKRLYSRAAQGRIENVVGFDIDFKPPDDPNMVVGHLRTQAECKETAKRVLTSALQSVANDDVAGRFQSPGDE